jgi:hypothetical protein
MTEGYSTIQLHTRECSPSAQATRRSANYAHSQPAKGYDYSPRAAISPQQTQTTGEEDYDFYQGSSDASVIATDALTALEAYQPELTVQEAESDLTSADNGILDIAQTFRDAGLGEIVSAGAAAEPHPSANSTDTAPSTVALLPTPAAHTTSNALPITYLTSFPVPHVRLLRERGRVILALTGHPSGAQAQVRLLGRRGRSKHLTVLDTFTSSSTAIPIRPGTLKIQVRYIDPYDVSRASSWTMLLKVPTQPSKARLA